MIKRGLAFILTITIALCVAFPAHADNQTDAPSDDFEVVLDSISTKNYAEYVAENANYLGEGEAFTLDAHEYASNGDMEPASDEESVSWDFDVAVSGMYNLEIEYKPLGESADAVEFAIAVDGQSPFEESKSLFLPRNWENAGDIRHDNEGNEFAATVKQVDGFYKTYAFDPSGFNNDPLAFFLSSGNHKLTIDFVSDTAEIKSFSFSPIEDIPQYNDYLKLKKAEDYSGTPIIIEGEDAAVRSKKSIVPLSDNSSVSIYPQNAFVDKINYIGSKNWNRPGDTITWDVEIKKSGYYSIGFSYRQNVTLNETFYRTLKVDGEVPFKEAKTVAFEYTGSWDNNAFSDEDGNPYKIYLKEGKHTISLSVTLGPLSEVCAELDELTYELADFYRSMVMITGEKPDANRDYNLFTQIENYEGRLKSYVSKLDELLEKLYKITGDDSGSAPTTLRNMKDVLQKMLDNKYYAHQYKSRYYSNYAALSAWSYECTSMPLDIDAIFLSSSDNADKGRGKGFFSQAAFSIKRFLSSFTADYNMQDSNESDDSITIWVNWGRDQAKVLKNLVSSDFTANKGIDVNIKITNATLLQGILSGNGPDCAIQVSRSEPVNLAMRGGLYDLSQFDDYEDVMKRFMPSAGVPYEYEGGNYGIPSTQSFYMLFYRTDIFEQLGLELPQTWDEFLNVSNVLLRKNMQVGLPYIQITDMYQANNGVGALNIFPTLLMQKGLSIYNDDFTASTLNEPEVAETFVEWTNYYTKYGFPKVYDFYNRFRVGLMPMAVVSYTNYATLTAAAPEISRFWKMAPVPGVEQADGTINRTVSGGGSASIILKDAKNPELAWEFIKWWSSTDTQYSYACEIENILGASARHDTANVEALKKLSWDKDNLDALMQQWENVEEMPEIPGGYYLSRVIDQAFWNTTNGEDPYEMTEKWGLIANNEIERKREQYGK